MTDNRDAHIPHPATDTEAANGEGTASPPPTGDTLNRPIMDGASEFYGDEAEAVNPRLGMTDPELVRHPDEARSGTDEARGGTE